MKEMRGLVVKIQDFESLKKKLMEVCVGGSRPDGEEEEGNWIFGQFYLLLLVL